MIFNRFIFLFLTIGSSLIAPGQTREEPIMLRTQNCDIQGSLLIPLGIEKMEVVLIVGDSGPTDRNGNQNFMVNNALKMYAVALAEEGIASLRFDKRGVAASRIKGGAEVTFREYVDDIKDWIAMLRNDRRFSKVVIAGHTEGALAALVAISENCAVDGYISINGMGNSTDCVIKEQLSRNQTSQVKQVISSIIDKLNEGEITENPPVYLRNSLSVPMQKYLIPLFAYHPREMIKSIRTPILLMHGDKDIQISPEESKVLHTGNNRAKLVIVNNMNHILKECETMDRDQQLETFTDPSIPLADKLVDESVRFIKSL